MTREIKLTNCDLVAIVDDDDYDSLVGYNWYFDGGYALRFEQSRGKKTKSIRMHRQIMRDIPSGMLIDHINQDKLDNRKENLRICTRSDNFKNVKKRNDCSSKYKGVSIDNGKYRVRLTSNGSNLNVGTFSNEDAAGAAYNFYAKQYYGEFVWLNDVEFPNWRDYQYRKSSIYTGVSYAKKNSKYHCYIGHGRDRVNIGWFDDENEAAIAYNMKALELFGLNAKLNTILTSALPSKFILNGRAGAGKDTLADLISSSFGYGKIAFADKIYEIARSDYGMKQKDRALLQMIGESMRREDPDVFVKLTMEDAGNYDKVVISDCRRANEYENAIRNGFVPIRIVSDFDTRVIRCKERDGSNPDTSLWELPTETGADNFSYVEIENNGTVADLYRSFLDKFYYNEVELQGGR